MNQGKGGFSDGVVFALAMMIPSVFGLLSISRTAEVTICCAVAGAEIRVVASRMVRIVITGPSYEQRSKPRSACAVRSSRCR